MRCMMVIPQCRVGMDWNFCPASLRAGRAPGDYSRWRDGRREGRCLRVGGVLQAIGEVGDRWGCPPILALSVFLYISL